jgi:EmrB/QacA subfamily drug resistance transporter
MTNVDISPPPVIAPPPPPPTVGRPRSALPVLLCAVFMIVLDFFAVNVALPSIQARLHASSSAIEWVVAGYGLTFAVMIITGGRLGDLLGRRRVFSVGLGLFTVASALCGLAPNPSLLVIARLVQGLGGALISPNVLSIIGVSYAGPARVRAITFYGMVMGLAAAGGQLIGGILIQANLFGWGWRTVFLINVPAGLIALVFAPRRISESRAQGRIRLDVPGTSLVTLGLTALVLPLVEGTQLHWPTWTWGSLALAPLLFAAFASHERRMTRRGGMPLFDPVLFRRKTLLSGLVIQLVFWCGQASFFLVFALYLQSGRGLDALDAGVVFSILAVAYLATSFRAPSLTLRFGRALIATGAVILAAGDAVLLVTVAHLGVSGSVWLLAPGLVLVGAGMGLCITPLTSTVLSYADPERAGAVSGALSTMQQVGNSLGVAVTGAIFFGSLAGGYAHAFELSVAELGGLLLSVAALSRLLPKRSVTQ